MSREARTLNFLVKAEYEFDSWRGINRRYSTCLRSNTSCIRLCPGTKANLSKFSGSYPMDYDLIGPFINKSVGLLRCLSPGHTGKHFCIVGALVGRWCPSPPFSKPTEIHNMLFIPCLRNAVSHLKPIAVPDSPKPRDLNPYPHALWCGQGKPKEQTLHILDRVTPPIILAPKSYRSGKA